MLRHCCAPIVCCLCWLCCLNLGCSSGQASNTVPEAKERITRLFQLYRTYCDKNQKGPPNEQALRDFGQKLTSKEREDHLIGEDLENIFTSPRDNQKFQIRYNVKVDPGQNRAIIWESTGQNGKRWVALSIGYVEEYDAETFKDYNK